MEGHWGGQVPCRDVETIEEEKEEVGLFTDVLLHSYHQKHALPSVTDPRSLHKAQLHWASLLATRLRIYSLLLNSLCVITLSCKVAARSASANEVEGWATFVATRWRF